jgi:hypothetical protein
LVDETPKSPKEAKTPKSPREVKTPESPIPKKTPPKGRSRSASRESTSAGIEKATVEERDMPRIDLTSAMKSTEVEDMIQEAKTLEDLIEIKQEIDRKIKLAKEKADREEKLLEDTKKEIRKRNADRVIALATLKAARSKASRIKIILKDNYEQLNLTIEMLSFKIEEIEEEEKVESAKTTASTKLVEKAKKAVAPAKKAAIASAASKAHIAAKAAKAKEVIESSKVTNKTSSTATTTTTVPESAAETTETKLTDTTTSTSSNSETNAVSGLDMTATDTKATAGSEVNSDTLPTEGNTDNNPDSNSEM